MESKDNTATATSPYSGCDVQALQTPNSASDLPCTPKTPILACNMPSLQTPKLPTLSTSPKIKVNLICKKCNKSISKKLCICRMASSVYDQFKHSICLFEPNPHYHNIMCLKDTIHGPSADDNECLPYLKDVITLDSRDNLKYKCVLPKNHSGNCSHHFNKLFINNEHTKKLISSINLAIYTTPGNDDYVYKNRSSRLFKYALSASEEKKIRDKTIKKRCAIPLKDASTPILLAQAYIDWFTYIINVKDVNIHLNPNAPLYLSIIDMLNINKIHLTNVFSNRTLFNELGQTICVITRNIVTFEDIADITRDNRQNIKDTDIQMGHNCPRNDSYVSIRGENLLPMSRRGNLIIGEKKFTDDAWIHELRAIISSY